MFPCLNHIAADVLNTRGLLQVSIQSQIIISSHEASVIIQN